MAKVRVEAAKKENIFQRFFFPLSIKLPIQAVAVLFLAVTAFYIYQSIHPTAKYAEAPTQEFAATKDSSPATTPEIRKTDDSLLRSKQIPQTSEYKALDRREEYKATPSLLPSNQVGASAPAPAKPAEQLASAKKEMSREQPAVAPQAPGKAEMQDKDFAAGATSQAEARSATAPAKKAKTTVDKAASGRGLKKDTLEKHPSGNPKRVVTYAVVNSRRVLIGEERFNPAGERDGLQKEYYASGQIKTEAQYIQGKLEWYQEYGPDGVKKIGKSDYDWLWLRE